MLSAADPVRVFQEFATLDLISHGRAEIVAGRGSLELLKIRGENIVHWSGQHRAALMGQAICPRPLQNPLPIWVGVGGTPTSFGRAGMLGLPLMVAIMGGDPERFRLLIDLYREAGRRAGHAPQKLTVGLHLIGFLGDTTEQVADDFFPGFALRSPRSARNAMAADHSETIRCLARAHWRADDGGCGNRGRKDFV